MGRHWAGLLAFVAAGALVPLGCGLATSGLGQPEGTKPHDAAIPDTRPIGLDGSGAEADAVVPPPADGAPAVDAPEDASDDPSDESQLPDAPPPCATGVLFCDGFEQGLGAWPNIEQNNGNIGLDTTHVHRGAQAVRAHEDAITQVGGNPNVTIDHTQTWPSHFWVCFEVEADVPSGTVHVSMNGTDLTDLDETGFALPSPDTTKLGLGFYDANTQGPYDVWFDDVIVDDKAIGCAK